MYSFSLQRRQWLHRMLFGSGLLGLRVIASGIPRTALARPETLLALSDEQAKAAISATENAQFLILSASDQGEPFNCNVPGLYDDANFKHPTADAMSATSFRLGNSTVTAAKVWSTLSESSLSRSCFFHYATNNQQHGGLSSVHKLGGMVAQGEMMVSAFGKILQEPLGCLQAQPISVGGGGSEILSFAGSQLPVFAPTALRNLLTTPTALAQLSSTQNLRDRDLDAINTLLKASGTPMQKQLLDAWAVSQQQARLIPQDILAQLNSLTDNTVPYQMMAAALIVQLKLAPVVVTHIPFGGDNHTDTDPHQGPGALPAEAAQHVSGVAAINQLTTTLSNVKLADAVTFATMSTFGRSNAPDLKGRSHNGAHNCSLIIGSRVNPTVVGGVVLNGVNPIAQDIDAATGKAGGNIKANATLAAFGATLGRTIGISTEQLATTIPQAVAVQAALTS